MQKRSLSGYIDTFNDQVNVIEEEEKGFDSFTKKQSTFKFALGGWMVTLTVASIILLVVIYKRLGRNEEPPSITRFKEERDEESLSGMDNFAFSKSSIVSLDVTDAASSGPASEDTCTTVALDTDLCASLAVHKPNELTV